MAATGTAPIQVSLDRASTGTATDDLLTVMLRANPRVSDLIFSPGRKLQVQVNGEFVPVEADGLRVLSADDTRGVASDLIGSNKAAISMLREQGYCDISYALSGVARFRVNIFIQRGSCAVVMRVIPTGIPDFKTLGLPEQLREIATLHDGLVLVTGPRGSGKSSSVAALLDYINETASCHIITIEDPIEFLHNHKRATFHQRELHSDTPSVAHALRAALRQAPNVIVVGELKDRETMELALEAAETGHLVMSTLHTIDASKTVERIVGVFPLAEQFIIRNRVAKSFRYIVSQRLIPRKDGTGRIAALEILKSTLRTREYLEKGEQEGKTLLDAMRDGDTEGMQHFDGEIEKLVRAGNIDIDTGLAYATNAGNLRLQR